MGASHTRYFVLVIVMYWVWLVLRWPRRILNKSYHALLSGKIIGEVRWVILLVYPASDPLLAATYWLYPVCLRFWVTDIVIPKKELFKTNFAVVLFVCRVFPGSLHIICGDSQWSIEGLLLADISFYKWPIKPTVHLPVHVNVHNWNKLNVP